MEVSSLELCNVRAMSLILGKRMVNCLLKSVFLRRVLPSMV
jgi:hypothetical protein